VPTSAIEGPGSQSLVPKLVVENREGNSATCTIALLTSDHLAVRGTSAWQRKWHSSLCQAHVPAAELFLSAWSGLRVP